MGKKMGAEGAEQIQMLCEKLISVFQDEEGIYLDLIKKEDEKKNAILKKDSASLVKISEEEEKILRVIDDRESERTSIIKELSSIFNKTHPFEKVSDLTSESGIDPQQKEKILHHSYALRELMFTLKNISDANQVILEDNKALFESIIEEIKGDTQSIEYTPGDRKKENNRPGKSLFIDING